MCQLIRSKPFLKSNHLAGPVTTGLTDYKLYVFASLVKVYRNRNACHSPSTFSVLEESENKAKDEDLE